MDVEIGEGNAVVLDRKHSMRLNKRLNKAKKTVGESNITCTDPWEEISKQLTSTREIVDAKYKRKLEKQNRILQELEARFVTVEEQIQDYKSLWVQDRDHNVELLKKLEELESSIHAITSNVNEEKKFL